MGRPRILLVYNADGGLMGEAAYFLKKGLGIAKCGLCEITHSGISERKTWVQCRSGIDAEFVGLHRNELSRGEREFISGQYPCVLCDRDGHLSWVVTPAEFEVLGPDPTGLAEVVSRHLAAE